MAGISSKALAFADPKNKKGYNGNELQSKEFNDGSGLDFYDFNARTYDQQTGRFVQIDPKADEHNQEILSPYHFCNNNPISHNDPDGKCWLCNAASAVWDYSKGRIQGAANALTSGLKQQYQAATTVYNYATNSQYRSQVNTAVKQVINNPQQAVTNVKKAANDIKAKVVNAANEATNPANYTPGKVGNIVGNVEGNVLIGMAGGPGVSVGTKAAGATEGFTTLYRAASATEIADASANGVRNISGQYSTGKLFATSASDAAQYGKNNFGLDGIPNTIMKVDVPNSILKTAYMGEMDGMKAVSIPTNQLSSVKFTGTLNYSPKPTNPFGNPGW